MKYDSKSVSFQISELTAVVGDRTALAGLHDGHAPLQGRRALDRGAAHVAPQTETGAAGPGQVDDTGALWVRPAVAGAVWDGTVSG